MHPDLKAVAEGHTINGRAVVTGSLWADVVMTVGRYLYQRIAQGQEIPILDVTDMKVFEAQVLSPEKSSHLIEIVASLDIAKMETEVEIYTLAADGTRNTDKVFAQANVRYLDRTRPRTEPDPWEMTAHLVAQRIKSINSPNPLVEDQRAGSGLAHNVFSSGVAYRLFENVVTYSSGYRGMRRVVLAADSLEATATVQLDADRHGDWHTPPHWIDSTFQLAGFVMNSFGDRDGDGKTSGSSRDFFYITPGWRSFRLLEPLAAGPVTYQNYVRMTPLVEEPGTFSGDIYLLRDDELMGLCAGIKFKAVPRSLMPFLFPALGRKTLNPGPKPSPPAGQTAERKLSPAHQPIPAVPCAGPPSLPIPHNPTPLVERKDNGIDAPAKPTIEPSDKVGQARDGKATACLSPIAKETGLDVEDLVGSAAFADLGVDSLMSLALSAKFRSELGIDVQSSIFLECPTVDDFLAWLSR